MMNSYVLHKEQCPQCRGVGNDRSQDNLVVYSDGHSYCFSCKYATFPNTVERFKNKEPIDDKNEIYLPVDCDIIYPQRALDWCAKYELTKTDLYNNNVLWSDSLQRLIFPVYGGNGMLIAWQGRSFHLQDQAIAKIPKWFGKGNLKDTFNILGKGNSLVLVEDIISAIKVSKCGVMAMPLYGSFVGLNRFKRLYNQFKDEVVVLVWLDYDKSKEALKESKLGLLCGLSCSTIVTKLDPKEFKYEEIKEILNV